MKMTIRSKILVSVFCLVLVTIIGLYISSQTILLNSYLELEHEAMHVNLERVRLALDDELTKMGVTNRDWGVWDDTYNFIQDKNQDYIDANLTAETLAYLGLDLMLFVDNEGQAVYEIGVDTSTPEVIPVPEEIKAYVQPGSPLLVHDTLDHLYREIVTIPGETYLLISGPILPTNGQGDIAGSLVFARLITPELIASIADVVQITFTIWNYNGISLPENIQNARTQLADQDHFIELVNEQITAGYIAINDSSGQPALIIRVEMPRDIYLQGQATVNFYLLAAVLASAGLGLLIYLLMGRLVIKRLTGLTGQIQKAGQSGNFSPDMKNQAGDEITLLSAEMATAFQRLKTANEELRESEENYKVLVSLGTESGEAIVMLQDIEDVDGKQVFVSDSWSRLTGYTPVELKQTSFFALLSPQYRSESLARHRQKIQGEKLHGFYQMAVINKNGNEVPIEVTSSMTNFRGQPVNVLYIRDISERQKMEEALRREEEQKERLLNDTVEIIQSVAPDGKYIFVNQAWHQLLGYTAEDMKRLTVFDVIHPDDQEHCRTMFAEVMANHQVNNISVTFATKDGRKVNVEGNVVPRVEDGKVTATHDFFRDVTERIKIDQARRESERMYAALVDNLPGFVYRCANDKQWTMQFISDGCYQITGYRPEEFIDNKRLAFSDIIQPDIREAIFNQWQEVVDQHKSFEKEYPIITAGGETRWVWERGQGVFSDTGELLFLEGFITDVTENKVAQAKEKQLRDKAEMSSRLAAVGEMAAGIAHEINNPLTGVIGFSEMLMTRESLPDDIQEDLKIINDGSQRVKEIIRRMLIFAQQSKPSSQLSDVHELIENTLELRSYVLRTAGIEVVREYSADLPPMMVDPGQLQQVFLNLIVNAEYAMKKAHGRGKLIIRTEQVDGLVRISFEDDGDGVPAEAKARLFQPFFTTKEPGEGTGLGLSLSRGIVLEHGGTIEEDGEAGVGARFVITLPIVTTEGTSPLENPPTDSVPAAETIRGLRVLVIDDEITIRAYVRAMLTRNDNIVDEAGAYGDAMVLLSERDYDIVLLDIRMPDKSGIEVYSEIVTHWPHLSRRILFITGDVSDQVVKEYLNKHNLAWITKPFDRATLELSIGKIMDKGDE